MKEHNGSILGNANYSGCRNAIKANINVSIESKTTLIF